MRIVASIDPRLDVVEAELKRMSGGDRILFQGEDHVPIIVSSRRVEATLHATYSMAQPSLSFSP